jgi:subtilase family serine protease
MSLLLAGCKPDLVITTFQTTGSAIVNPQGSVEVPIRVVVKNQGTGNAGIFKVATHYTDPGGSTYVVAFTVPGQSSIWYPYTSAPLAAGSDVTFAGKVTFHPAVHGVTVYLKGTADSCSGDEFMPNYCRVQESNEGNNESTPIQVSLPSLP